MLAVSWVFTELLKLDIRHVSAAMRTRRGNLTLTKNHERSDVKRASISVMTETSNSKQCSTDPDAGA